MRDAIRLSKRGFPAPNPHVGCVIVKSGEAVGRGFHAYAGGPHAEIVALKQAGQAAKGADVYVTLEPCGHHGRTPPCANALTEAGVARVFVACEDPNPEASAGVRSLRAAGIRVETGILAPEAEEANEHWLIAMRRGRPYVCIKSAVGLDGRIATASGESKWITSEVARRAGRRLRAEMGAVLVGERTVRADDPRLTARIRGLRSEPTRVILDPEVRLSGSERVFREAGDCLWIVAEGSASSASQVGVPCCDGKFDLRALLDELWMRGLTGVLVEGGAETSSSFVQAGLADRVELFVAPKVLGDGLSWVQGISISSVDSALELNWRWIRRIGRDLWIRADFAPCSKRDDGDETFASGER